MSYPRGPFPSERPAPPLISSVNQWNNVHVDKVDNTVCASSAAAARTGAESDLLLARSISDNSRDIIGGADSIGRIPSFGDEESGSSCIGWTAGLPALAGTKASVSSLLPLPSSPSPPSFMLTNYLLIPGSCSARRSRWRTGISWSQSWRPTPTPTTSTAGLLASACATRTSAVFVDAITTARERISTATSCVAPDCH